MQNQTEPKEEKYTPAQYREHLFTKVNPSDDACPEWTCTICKKVIKVKKSSGATNFKTHCSIHADVLELGVRQGCVL
jgi:hypothetical protein